ncbi:MAG: hypothetical protein F2934_05315 [Actinobacteria bacterium]|uniref:Unannotated protein n=1 Tax=freshwater metagenome TaxID=449393 RepID=A0A6J6UPK1_9ZZZZ|nr:hypothetical protein [Actinomycetota bacterium]MSY12998.1 hypothetical protein [Actinomycetota bacterium]MSZ04418.1 hypothetical protein [Actinomycetota bacterium]MTB06535.1 hypothetical protein [Actinomycetota bacterium]
MGASRRYVFPEPGDTLATLAERVMPGQPDAAKTLLSWNLHLAMRPFPVGEPGEILCTDVVYLEPPTARAGA